MIIFNRKFIEKLAHENGNITELEQRTGVSKQILSQWITGASFARIDTICELANKLNFKLQDMVNFFANEKTQTDG